MKKIEVPYTSVISYESSIEEISKFLEESEMHSIAEEPWPLPGNKPLIGFSIAHSGSCIFIKYQVEEDFVRAVNRVSNEPVYQDSCVEFFISLAGENEYYNLEFNCVGTCLMAVGTDRHYRHPITSTIIEQIKRGAFLSINKGSRPVWELIVAIPPTVFIRSDTSSFNDLKCRANFYKCGDKLPFPHFFAWNNIELPLPDFHSPDWFGELHFENGQ